MLQTARQLISFFIARYLSLPKMLLIFAPAFCLDIYIHSFEIGPFTQIAWAFVIPALLLQNHKAYKFKARKDDCIAFFSALSKEFPKLAFDKKIYIQEISNSNDDFLYTEVMIPFDSDYRVAIEEGALATKAPLPIHKLLQK